MKASEGTFGFIKVEDGTEMFVLPSYCQSFGSNMHAIGMRITFRTVIYTKTNKTRLEAVTLQSNSNLEATTPQRNDVWTHSRISPSTKPIGS